MNKKYLSLFICLISLNFLSFSTYGLPIAFFPNIAKNRGISASLVGIIFAMYPLGAFICSFIVGKMLNLWERKRVIIISEFLMGLSVLTFGLSSLLPINFFFILIALIARTTQGISVGAYGTAAYAFIPDYWPEEIDIRIAILEMTVGLGIGFGPLIGALLYEIWGYMVMFAGPGIMIACFGPIIAYYIIPANRKQKEEKEEEETLSIIKCFSEKEMCYNFLVLVINFAAFTLIMPELENKVIELGGSPVNASIIFVCSQLGYIMCIPFLIFYKFENRKCLFFIALVLSIISLIMLGIDFIIPLENKLTMMFMAAGLFIAGIVDAFSLIPNISENIAILHKIFPNKKKSSLDNMASGMFTAAISLAEFYGPILGGFLSDLYGFSKCCLIYSFVVFIFFIIYAFDGKGYEAFLKWFKSIKNEKTQEKNIELKLLDQNSQI